MNLETGATRVPIWILVASGVIIVIAVLGYWYYKADPAEAKLVGFLGGVVTGLVVYLATFLSVLGPLRELDRFHRMGIRGLLANRHDKLYYRSLVKKSRQRVDVMGASCNRFVRDFLDPDADDKVLVDALSKHNQLRVRLMIPDDEHMTDEARDIVKHMLPGINKLRMSFGDRVEVRRFNDRARHSFVLVDGDLIAGPVFDGDRSRHAPAVHVALETLFGQKYSAYFDELWRASPTA
ncbi:hypothetical protein [Magnetospirillum sp. LM-5]|uniref:hypothetical protein n=1 Tax=Magnetospirillum sp. LM-5 TaxID=2681466 RepID=UPI00156DC2CC|nr:hypothetical protein [Magnetospirillum sp. LM-5]